MNKLRTRYLAVGLSIAAVAAAGCGSSSKSKTTPASPATPSTQGLTPTGTTGTSTTGAPKSAFAAQLNALCHSANQQAKSTGQDLKKLAVIAEQLLPKLEALQPSAADKAAYTEFIANTKAEIAAAKKNDAQALQKLVNKDKGLGKQLGAPECG